MNFIKKLLVCNLFLSSVLIFSLPGCNQICTDNDNDGFCAEDGDCNDSNALITPFSQEDCNDGIDNNCNRLVDIYDSQCSQCVDEDGDGFCAYEDCDDSNFEINLSAQENCNDGIDNNCNGFVDSRDSQCSIYINDDNDVIILNEVTINI